MSGGRGFTRDMEILIVRIRNDLEILSLTRFDVVSEAITGESTKRTERHIGVSNDLRSSGAHNSDGKCIGASVLSCDDHFVNQGVFNVVIRVDIHHTTDITSTKEDC